MNNKRFSVPCLKYLLSLSKYKRNHYVTNALPVHLLIKAKEYDFTDHNLTQSTLFKWLNGYKVPVWGQVATFELALDNGWTPLDLDDIWCVVWVLKHQVSKPVNRDKLISLISKKKLVIPQSQRENLDFVIDSITNDLNHKNDLHL